MIPFLLGCPFVWSPPDLSRVPVEDTDVDTDPEETDTDTDLDPLAPVLAAFDVALDAEGFRYAFRFSDLDGDAVGGTLELSGPAGTTSYSLPWDVDVWDPYGTSTVLLDWPCEILEADLTLRMTDHAGRSSASVSRPVSVRAGADAETGNKLDAATDLGEVALPLVFCGSIDGQNDADYLVFRAADTADVTLTLDWDYATGVEVRTELFSCDPAQDADEPCGEDAREKLGGVDWEYPEVIVASLVQGSTYLVEIQALLFYGVAPPYFLHVDAR